MRNFIIKGYKSQKKDDLGKTLFESAKRSDAQEWVSENGEILCEYCRIEMGTFHKEKAWNDTNRFLSASFQNSSKPTNEDLDAELATLHKVTREDVDRLIGKYSVSEATIRRRFGNLKKE